MHAISAVHRGEHLPAGAARDLFAEVLSLITELAAVGRNIR